MSGALCLGRRGLSVSFPLSSPSYPGFPGRSLVKETQEVRGDVKLLVFPFFPDFCHQKRDAGQEGRQDCLRVKGRLLTHLGTIGTTSNTCSYLGNIPQLLIKSLLCSRQCPRVGSTAVNKIKLPALTVLIVPVGVRENQ